LTDADVLKADATSESSTTATVLCICSANRFGREDA
jgi:hypothetical protein